MSDAPPLRILWVPSQLEWRGGIGRVVAQGSQALAARGHDVHVAGPARDGDPGPLTGVTVHRFPKRPVKALQLLDLVPLARRIDPDVVHFHAAMPHGDVIAGLRWLGLPHVPVIAVTAHSSRPYAKRRARLGLRQAGLVIVPSEWAAAHARDAGAHSETVHVIPAGIDAGPPPEFAKREPIVLALGRLTAVKNFGLLVDAFARVTTERRDWQLWIAGEGPERDALLGRARAAGLETRVRLLGWIAGAEKDDALGRAAIGAVPSQRESFGGALLEMQARGLACVASDTGGLAELAERGAAARLVPPGDELALARELAALMDDGEARRALAIRGRSAAERYDWSEIAARYECVYRSARPPRS